MAEPFWMPLAEWAKIKDITIGRAAQLAREGRIRVGKAIAARKIGLQWIIRSDATYEDRRKGNKGRHTLKRKRNFGRHWTSGPDNGLPFWQ